jgi:hypothetical protein
VISEDRDYGKLFKSLSNTRVSMFSGDNLNGLRRHGLLEPVARHQKAAKPCSVVAQERRRQHLSTLPGSTLLAPDVREAPACAKTGTAPDNARTHQHPAPDA